MPAISQHHRFHIMGHRGLRGRGLYFHDSQMMLYAPTSRGASNQPAAPVLSAVGLGEDDISPLAAAAAGKAETPSEYAQLSGGGVRRRHTPSGKHHAMRAMSRYFRDLNI